MLAHLLKDVDFKTSAISHRRITFLKENGDEVTYSFSFRYDEVQEELKVWIIEYSNGRALRDCVVPLDKKVEKHNVDRVFRAFVTSVAHNTQEFNVFLSEQHWMKIG